MRQGTSLPKKCQQRWRRYLNAVDGAKKKRKIWKKKRVEEIGLFPLGMVLNPGAQIPLHIFEMRYRQLFNQAWQGDTKVSFASIVGLFCLSSRSLLSLW